MTRTSEEQVTHERSKGPQGRYLADLGDELSRLGPLLESFRIRNEHYAGDLCLRGFARHVWENASAVLHLAKEAPFAAAIWACGRAAFEAGQDALLLAAASDYELFGARAFVFERLQIADNNRQMILSTCHAEPKDPPYLRAKQDIEEEALKWDQLSPGKGKYLRDAMQYWRPKFEAARSGKHHPRHWSELSRKRIAKTLADRGSEASVAEALGSDYGLYAILSRYAHPRARTASGRKSDTDPETMNVAALPALIGVQLVIRALSLRKRQVQARRIIQQLERIAKTVPTEVPH